ncbi:hypothetical protein BCR42DRAFT_451578 [Absidia repens]|uniref:Uncharacterized protein n=1 Tax=Absidia repens TaxID=90262 RepID=A0A1X2IFL1_9FUNG|nr:hypothetical protein BCR42DRAFT_451578 [Absidia repens]
MVDTFADTQSYLVDEPERSFGSTSTASHTKCNNVTPNIPQKRPYTSDQLGSVCNVNSLAQYSDNIWSGGNQNSENSSPIPTTDEYGNSSPLTNSTDALYTTLSSPHRYSLNTWSPSLEQTQSSEQQHLLYMPNSYIEEDSASLEMTNRDINNNHTIDIYSFVLDQSQLSSYEPQQQSSFPDSPRISDQDESYSCDTPGSISSSSSLTENTRPPLNFIQRYYQQQLEHNSLLQVTSTTVKGDTYDVGEPAGFVMDDDDKSTATLPYDVGEPAGYVVDDDDKSTATLPYDVGEPAGSVVDDDDKSTATLPYDVGEPAGSVIHNDIKGSTTVPYDEDSYESHVALDCEGDDSGSTALYNVDDLGGFGVDNESNTRSIYDMNGFDGFGFAFEHDSDNDNSSCDGSPFYEDCNVSHSLNNTTIKSANITSNDDDHSVDDNGFEQPSHHVGLNELAKIDTTASDSTFDGDYYVLDSQPESFYNIEDGYDSNNDCMTNMVDSTNSRSPPQPQPNGPTDSDDMNPTFHDSSNESRHQSHDPEQHNLPTAITSSTTKLETISEADTNNGNNHSQQKLQQTLLEVFYSQLSATSSLSTAKSFYDTDDSTPPFAAAQPLVLSSSPPHKNPTTSSLDQLRMAKAKKRSTQSPKEEERWLPASRKHPLSIPPQAQSSLSFLSDSLTHQEQQKQTGNGKKSSPSPTSLSSLPPSPDRLKCRPPRRRIPGLSKPKNASSLVSTQSAPSIASMLSREHQRHHNSLQLTNTITKSSSVLSITPRKKTLGMLRQRSTVYK